VDKRLLQARGFSDNNLFAEDEINPHPMGGTVLRSASGFGLTVVVDGNPAWVSVFWGGELGALRTSIRGWDASRIEHELRAHSGEVITTLDLTDVKLDLRDAASILAALTVLCGGRTETFSGDLPPGASWSWLPPHAVFH
jgi:hypothetical protein